MGTFLLISAIQAIIFLWSFPPLAREKRRADIAVFVCLFLLAWAAAGAACIFQPPGLFGLISKNI